MQQQYAKNRRQLKCKRLSSGMTLIEVMVVLIILVMIAGLAVTAVQGQRVAAAKRTAYTYVKMLEQNVERYELDMGRPPTTEQGLAALISVPSDIPNPADWGGPYLRDTATSRDPWGNQYQYASPGRNGRSFEIWSFGPDLIDGTDDDIANWKNPGDF